MGLFKTYSEKEVKRVIESKYRKEFREYKRNIEKDYPIELAINQRIDSMIEERAMGMLNGAIEKIISYNTAPQKQKTAIEESFTPEQKKLKESIEKLVMSYFADDIREKAQSKEQDPRLMTEAVKEDVVKFMKAFVEFVSDNDGYSNDKKSSLANIFKLISNKTIADIFKSTTDKTNENRRDY